MHTCIHSYCTFDYAVAPYNATINESIVNDTTIYTCYADGGPGNQYYWVHQEGSIEFSQLLAFTRRDQSNEGTYICTITNDADTVTRSISFTGTYICQNRRMILFQGFCMYVCLLL